ELDLAHLAVFGLASERADLEIVALDRHDVEIIQVHGVAGIRDNGADVTGEKVLVFADTENQRTAPPGADHKVRNISVHKGDPIGTNDLLQSSAHGIYEARFGIFSVQLLIDAADE